MMFAGLINTAKEFGPVLVFACTVAGFAYWLRGQFADVKDFVRDQVRAHEKEEKGRFEEIDRLIDDANLRLMKIELSSGHAQPGTPATRLGMK